MVFKNLLDNNKLFKESKFYKYEHKFKELVEQGQSPKALFIGCCDSRILPNLITGSEPGDLFIVRNIGNFVPPYKPDEDYHSTASAIEYAVSVLEVTDIIVCGHSHCGAIKELYIERNLDDRFIHVKTWLKLGEEARDLVKNNLTTESDEEKLIMTEKLSILFQMQNLLTYPEVKKMVEEGKLFINGWYYKIESGEIMQYNQEKEEFENC